MDLAQLHVLHVPGHVPERDTNAAQLADAGACIHRQDTPPSGTGLITNWLTVLQCAQRRPEPWTVMLSDDAELLPGWQRHLPLALSYSPRPLLALTHFAGWGQTAASAGYAYGVGRNLVWGVAYAMRTELMPALSAFAEWCLTLDPGYPHDDGIAALFTRRSGTALAARAIFGHLPVPSLVGHGKATRTTHNQNDGHKYPHLTITGKGPPWSTPGAYVMSAGNVPRTLRLAATLDRNSAASNRAAAS